METKDRALRIRKLMTLFNLNQSEFADKIGINQSNLSNILKGIRPCGDGVANKILLSFPDINDKWLLFGIGEMLKTESNNAVNNGTINGNMNTGTNAGATIVHRSDVIDCSQFEQIPFVNKHLSEMPNVSIRDLVSNRDKQLEQFPFYKMCKNVDYIQTVATMAMAPRYMAGDYLFVSFNDTMNVQSGKLYLVDTKHLGCVLRLVYAEQDGYLMKAYNPQFKDIFVSHNDIYSISQVVLSVNVNTSLTIGLDLADVVRKRDEEIKALTEKNAYLIRQQEKLIDEIRLQSQRIEDTQSRLNKFIDLHIK